MGITRKHLSFDAKFNVACQVSLCWARKRTRDWYTCDSTIWDFWRGTQSIADCFAPSCHASWGRIMSLLRTIPTALGSLWHIFVIWWADLPTVQAGSRPSVSGEEMEGLYTRFRMENLLGKPNRKRLRARWWCYKTGTLWRRLVGKWLSRLRRRWTVKIT